MKIEYLNVIFYKLYVLCQLEISRITNLGIQTKNHLVINALIYSALHRFIDLYLI